MEMVYLVNGAESGGGGGGASGYPLVRAVVTDGAVGLQDRSVTRIELKTADAVRINFPPRTDSVARDFILRLVITADTVPEVTFAVPAGETFSFEEGDDETFTCVVGVNVFAFTETDPGVFVVNRKAVSIVQVIAFDANGGVVDAPSKDYLLGAKYGSLPVPRRAGYTFLGWYTDADGGVEVAAGDVVMSSVSTLHARWEVYVDPFAPHIGGDGLVFTTEGDGAWRIDEDVSHGGGGSARSGAIGDNQSTSLVATTEGAGTISFFWRVSSEDGYDWLRFVVDGATVAEICGEYDDSWREVTHSIAGRAAHTVEWRYSKDGSVSNGQDCGWVDDVSWTPEGGS